MRAMGGNDLPQVDAPCFAVRGNCDWVSDLPMELLLPLGGKRIFLCHGHGYGVKNGLLRLFYRAREQGADYAVFGHTHHSLIAQREGIFLVNPGSIGAFYGKGGPTFALLDTESAGRCDILTLD